MPKTIIEFKDFSFKYDSQAEPTLKQINLTIKQGEKLLIAGPSGSGKSTIGRCINGLIPNLDTGETVSYTHLTLPTTLHECRSRWSPYH